MHLVYSTADVNRVEIRKAVTGVFADSTVRHCVLAERATSLVTGKRSCTLRWTSRRMQLVQWERFSVTKQLLLRLWRRPTRTLNVIAVFM
jgi:hypothetical protein